MKPETKIATAPKTFSFAVELDSGSTRALQTIAKKHFKIPFKADYPAESLVLLHALQFALTRPDELSEFIYKLGDYQNKEGLNAIVHGEQLVQNNPAYRKKRLPEELLPRVI